MRKLPRVAGWTALACAVALAAPSSAQQTAPAADSIKAQQQRRLDQPGNNAPVWREVKAGQQNYSSLPGREMGVLVQPQARFPGQGGLSTAGEAWRKFHNGPITVYGGWLIVLVALAILAFYFARGPLKLREKPTGRLIERFSALERWAHWSTAITFCVMALSGLTILFGKYVLLPILGYTLFGWLTALCKNLHNFVAPLFVLSLLITILVYIRDNFPEKGDLAWLAGAFAIFWSGKHVPAGRFNAGEKAYFWLGVVALCIVLSVSGAVMLFPNFEQLRTTMQQANVVHAVAAILMIALAFGHIYIGTIGIEGAYRNMRDGVTDETWAREHHELWYNDVKSGKAAAKSGAAPQTQH